MTKDYNGTLGQSLVAEIRNSPDYHDGEIECLKARLNKTTEILGKVIDCLGNKTKSRIAKEFNYEEEDNA